MMDATSKVISITYLGERGTCIEFTQLNLSYLVNQSSRNRLGAHVSFVTSDGYKLTTDNIPSFQPSAAGIARPHLVLLLAASCRAPRRSLVPFLEPR